MTEFDALESPIHPTALFPVEAPDGRKDLPELERQVMFRKLMRERAPRLMVFANANAGKRNPFQANREGIRAGVFDMTVAWDIADATTDGATVAYVEFKGYDASARPGKLSLPQIEWGNAMHERGHKVACFFSARSAVRWLREIGAPIPGGG